MTLLFRFELDGELLPGQIPDELRERFPGAHVFLKWAKYAAYVLSPQRNRFLAARTGSARRLVLNLPEPPASMLFQDDTYAVLKAAEPLATRSYRATYHGPRPYSPPPADTRPACIRHRTSLYDWCTYNYYRSSDEEFGYGALLGAELGLARIAVKHEILPSGRRASWPHAHKEEEELVYVLEGEVDVYLNGDLHPAKAGDALYFPHGTGHAHTVINNGATDVALLVLGEQEKAGDKLFYPHHPQQNEVFKTFGEYWEDHPQLPLGPHDGTPVAAGGRGGPGAHAKGGHELILSTGSVPAQAVGAPDAADRVHYLDRDLGRKLGTKRVALHHVTLPSGCRSSLPHAESLEEEFVYVLKGSPIAWINGRRYALREGDGVAFPSGTGVLHTFLNESGAPAELIVTGETTKKANLCAFPLNPERRDDPIWWADSPAQELGDDSPLPDCRARLG